MAVKNVVITGASGDIGIKLAETFYNAGHNLILLYNKNKDSINKFIKKNKDDNHKIISLQCDFSIDSDVIDACKKIKSQFNHIDVIINNAGIGLVKFFDETNIKEWDYVFSVNVKSAFIITKELIGDMINRKSGNIINIASMWGLSGASMEVCYSASKAALIGMSKALAKEVGPSNINVNVIAPGVIDTKMNLHLSDEDMTALKEETPINRIGKPEDVANAALFLASEEASFITGEIIKVDGGFIS